MRPTMLSFRLRRIAGIVLALVLWEVASRSGVVSDEYLPGIGAVFAALIEFVTSALFWDNLLISVLRALTGLALAVAIAFGLAILAGRYGRVRRMFEPMSDFLRAIPPPALIPVGIFAVGLTPGLYMLVISFGCIWPIYISASNALSAPEPVHIQMARSFGIGPWRTMWLIRLPAALPEALTGLRLSASIALLSAVATEMLLGTNGLGALIFNAGFSLLWDDMYALMVVIGLTGLVFNMGVAAIRWLVAGWQVEMVKLGATA